MQGAPKKGELNHLIKLTYKIYTSKLVTLILSNISIR